MELLILSTKNVEVKLIGLTLRVEWRFGQDHKTLVIISLVAFEEFMQFPNYNEKV